MIILSISLFFVGKVRVKWKFIQNENSRGIGDTCRWIYHNKFESGKFIESKSDFISMIFVLHQSIVEYVLYTNSFVLGKSRREKTLQS